MEGGAANKRTGQPAKNPAKLTPKQCAPGAIEGDPAAGGLRRSNKSRQKGERLVVPVVEEEVHVGRRVVETGRVRINRTVEEQTVTVDEPLEREELVVRRVPVNRPVDAPLPVRHEGEVTIIPIVEEVVVIEKRLVLVEEVYVERKRAAHRDPQQVVVRKERAEVERLPAEHPGENIPEKTVESRTDASSDGTDVANPT